MSEFQQVPTDLYPKITSFIVEEYKPFVDYIYRSRLVTVAELMEKFPEVGETGMDLLSVIGKVNGRLWSKFNVSVYPAEVNSTILESAYSLGVMVDV